MEKSQEEKRDASKTVGKTYKGKSREEVIAELVKTYSEMMAYWDEHPDELEDYVVD